MERWGAFSVIDHKNEIQLATELMLYDKIAVPTPTDREGDDWKRWQREGWEPEKLMTFVDRFKPQGLVYEVTWDLSREDSWRRKFEKARARIEIINATLQIADSKKQTVGRSKKAINQAIEAASYAVTRSEIVDYLRGRYSTEGANPNNAVDFWNGPVEFYAAYQSATDFGQLHPEEDAIQQGVERVNFLVQNRLAVPDEPPEKLLDRVIGIVTDEEFKKRRRVFYDYQIDLLKGGHKPESVLKDLNQLVIDYNAQTLAKSEKYRWEIVTTVFVVAGAALSALPVFLSPASPFVGPSAIAGAFGAAGPAVWNTLRARKDTDVPQRIAAPGAMFHQMDAETGFQFLTSRGSPRK